MESASRSQPSKHEDRRVGIGPVQGKHPVQRRARFGTEQIHLIVGEDAQAAFINHSQPNQARTHIGEINLAVLTLATDHAGLKGITLATVKATNSHRAKPFRDFDVLCLKVVGAKDGGFGKKCHRYSRNEKTRRGFSQGRVGLRSKVSFKG